MPATEIAAKPGPPERVLSIDALRGFDMFWIIGGDGFIKTLLGLTGLSFAPALAEQLEHVEWEGFRFYDLIFPLFLFLVGCVLPYSLERHREVPSAVYMRIARRTLAIVLLGFVCNRILDFQFSEFRAAGVLQRIGICYGLAALLCVHLKMRGQAIALFLILIGYWALLAWVRVPGGIAGDFTPEGNLCGYLDRQYLPGVIKKEYYGFGDNEGLLSTLPAVGTVLIGSLAGDWLRTAVGGWVKAGVLLGMGLAFLAIGNLWGMVFPIIKILWTSSFVMVAGGWSLVLLAFFYALIDVLHWQRWAFFWIVIGANAITIFVVPRFVDFKKMADFFLGGLAELSGAPWNVMIIVSGTLAAKWLFLWFLYRQKLFLRL